MKRTTLFAITTIMFMILACSFQGNVPIQTKTITPSNLGESGQVKIVLDHSTFEPGCQGILGFELKIINDSLSPITAFALNIKDDNNQTFNEIWWTEGTASTQCYQSSASDIYQLQVDPGQTIQIAFRVLGNLSPEFSQISVSVSWNAGSESLGFQIPAPLVSQLTCEPEKWRIIPLAKYEHPLGDGWKLLIVDLALSNQSSYWGEYFINWSKAIVSTNDGYNYSSVIGPMSIPSASGSPYSGEYINGGQIGGPPMVVGGGVSTLGSLPPGFSVYNITRLDRFTLKPANNHPFSLMFNVADNQSNFVIHVDSSNISCVFPDGTTKSEQGPAISLDLQNDIGTVTFPTTVEQNQFPEIPSLLDVPGKGTLQYLNSNRTSWDEYSDLVNLSFQYSSTSGYDTEGKITGYIIGDDGVVTQPGCGNQACSENDKTWYGPGYFAAGPGQTYLTDLGFLVAKQASNLKFIWLGEKGILPSYQVFRVP
jgi:hypothetical protein